MVQTIAISTTQPTLRTGGEQPPKAVGVLDVVDHGSK